MKPKFIVWVCGILWCCFGSAWGQNLDRFWWREGDIEEDLLQKLEPCITIVQNDSTNDMQTGVLLNISSSVYVLSNYHLLKNEQDVVSVYLTNDDGKQTKFEMQLVRVSTATDLAIFHLVFKGKKFAWLKTLGFEITTSSPGNVVTGVTLPKANGFLAKTIFAATSEIKRGGHAAFLGFPLLHGIVSKTDVSLAEINQEVRLIARTTAIEKHPLARFGRVASSFNGQDFFILDAMVNHGNSGSPVFIRYGYENNNTAFSGYKLAGIIKGFYADDIVFRSEDGKIVSMPHNSGLAIVISIQAISKLITGL